MTIAVICHDAAGLFWLRKKTTSLCSSAWYSSSSLAILYKQNWTKAMSCFGFSIHKSSPIQGLLSSSWMPVDIWESFSKCKFIWHLWFAGFLEKNNKFAKHFSYGNQNRGISQTVKKNCCRFCCNMLVRQCIIFEVRARLSDSRLVIAVYSSAVPGQSTSSQGSEQWPGHQQQWPGLRAVHAQPAAVICLCRGTTSHSATPTVCVLAGWAELVAQLPFTKQKRHQIPDTRQSFSPCLSQMSSSSHTLYYSLAFLRISSKEVNKWARDFLKTGKGLLIVRISYNIFKAMNKSSVPLAFSKLLCCR